MIFILLFQTINSLPGAFFLLSGGINIIAIFIFGTVYLRKKDLMHVKEEKSQQIEPVK